MTVQEHVVWLSKNGYVVKHKDFYLFTAKFNLAISGKDEGIVSCKTPRMRELSVADSVNWVLKFQLLIMEAGIPKYSSDGKGQSYQINGATKPGRELFQKVIESGELPYFTLRDRMKDYYHQNNGKYRVKVETYFEKEMWRDSGTVDKKTRSNDGITITEPNL